jgi:dipeptidyl aminopeptidase/acylaminoacyl peptidase
MVWRDRRGSELGTAAPPDDYWEVALSPSGRYLAANRHDVDRGEFRIWAGSLPGGQLEPLSESHHVAGMAWSADDTLHYSDYRTNSLYEHPMAAGSVEVTERALSPVCYPGNYSADGRTLVAELTQDAAMSQTVWTKGSNGTLNRVAGGGRSGVRPAISPNGRWMAFGSDERGVTEIYVTELPAATVRLRVSSGGASRPRWRHDGREIFYLTDAGDLMSVAVEEGVELHLGEPKLLFHSEVKGVPGDAQYDASSDGQRFVLLERMPGADPGGIEMILNWPSLLA